MAKSKQIVARAVVYRAISPVGKLYIGVTTDLERRKTEHRRHPKGVFGRSIRKYGFEAHRFEVVRMCTLSSAYRLERVLVHRLGTIAPYGLNCQPGGRGGQTPTPEVRERMSAWQRGRKLSVEHRANLSVAHRGQSRSAEQRTKQAAATAALWQDPVYRERVLTAQRNARFLVKAA